MATPTEARRLLSELADQAPNIDVTDRVLQHAARRRRRRTASAVALAVAGLAAVPVAVGRAQDGALLAGLPGVTAPAAPGWRWESYDGVRVQVPDSWAEGTTGSLWCQNDGPYVGRPGSVVGEGCDPVDPPPSKRYSYVWFGLEQEWRRDSPEGWTSDIVTLPGIEIAVTVFTDDPTIREHVLSTIEPN